MLDVAEHGAGEHQQVVELELAPAAAGGGLAQREPGELPGQPPHHRLGQPRVELDHLVAHGPDQFADVVDRAAGGPVVLPALVDATLRRADGQEPQLLVLVGGRSQLVVPGPVPRQQPEHLVVVGEAVLRAGPELLQPGEHGRERRRELGWVGLGAHALGHEVPVGVAGQGQRAQHGERRVCVEREEHRALELGVVEQLVDEAGPALLERELRRDVVEHLDAGRESGFDRVLGEDALRERVEGRHRGSVELLERARGSCGHHRIGIAREGFEGAPDAVAQLGGRLLGERDRGDLPHGHVARDHEGHDAVDERLGLARTGTGLDEEGLVEIVDDRGARRQVFVEVEEGLLPRRRAHPSPASATPASSPPASSPPRGSGSASSRYSRNSGAVRFRCHSR